MKGQLIGIGRLLQTHRPQCEEVLGLLAGPESVAGVRALAKLRERCGEEVARIVSAAARWQSQAQRKLASPDAPNRVWWVTDKSLQQATPWQVARMKANWFADDHVSDLCCGIGGDSLQLAARGALTAVDLDPVTAAMADANLAGSGSLGSQTRVLCADVTANDLPTSSSLHLDPDRRPDRQRRSDPNAYQPNWSLVSKLVAASDSAVIKLAPVSTIPAEGLPPEAFHRCWISLSGSVREQSLLWGSAIERAGRVRGERSAVVMRADGSVDWFTPDHAAASASPQTCGDPPAVLVDPNAAIRAAGLTEAFANQHSLRMLSGPAGYLGCDIDSVQRHESLTSVAVLGIVTWWGACDDRKLRKEFRARGVYPETIKVRGTDHDPAALVKRFRQCGEHPVTLWIGRHANRVFAAITQ